MIPVARQNVSPAAGAWNDVDVTAILGADAGNVAGVILEVNNSGGAYDFGARKNGSGDTLVGDVTVGHMWVYIGVDANDIFECYLENANTIVYLVGYVLNAEATFLTNMVNKTPGPNNSWEDVDISGDTGGETAICAFFIVDNNSSSNLNWGLRENGSGDNARGYQRRETIRGAAMAVDGSEILEGRKESPSTFIYLIGWMTANFVSTGPNMQNYSAAGAGAWLEVDMSGDIPAAGNGAFMRFGTIDTGMEGGGIRKLGDGFDNYFTLSMHDFLWVEIDSDRKAEQKVGHLDCDLFLFGYTLRGNLAPTAPTGQQVDGQSAPTGTNCISDLTPGFTAIYNDPDAGDQANAINIQVGTASGLSDMWDSGWLADATVTPNRCAVKTYAGAALSAGTSYWWRCRFRDDDNAVGAWSAWQQFDICNGNGVPGELPGGPGLQCVSGGPLPRRRPFTCATRMPREEPGYRFPYQFPLLDFPCH